MKIYGKIKQFAGFIILLVLCLAAADCDDPKKYEINLKDTEIKIREIGVSYITIDWRFADIMVPHMYQIYYSEFPNIETPQDAELYGKLVPGDYETWNDRVRHYVGVKKIAGLKPGVKYYFNVLVKNERTKKTYEMQSATTDDIIIHDSSIKVKELGEHNVTLSWQSADSLSGYIDYEVYYSLLPNLNTLDEITANGRFGSNTINLELGSDHRVMASAEIEALDPATKYYFNVVVKSEAHQKAYRMLEATTKKETSLNKGLVAYYPFNGNANDESGYGNDGVVHGANLARDRFGNPNSAYSFDGVNAFIELPKNGIGIENIVKNSGSVSLWMYVEHFRVPPNCGSIISFFDAGLGEDGITIRSINSNNGQIYSVFGASSGKNEAHHIYKNNVNSSTWYFVTLTWEPTRLSLYFNGQLINSINKNKIGSFYARPDRFLLGRYSGGTSLDTYFNGKIDDVRVYNRALSTSEVSELYNSERPIVIKSFQEFQTIPTNGARDWEHFTIDGEEYLAAANSYDGSNHNINSKIYKWSGSSFAEFQTIPTNGAYNWKYFAINGEKYLALANRRNNFNFNINSKIYKWNGSSFTEFQTIPTNGARDWEYFTIEGKIYLAVANSYNSSTYNINSKIYKWNGSMFVEFQSIPTNSACDWKYLNVNGDSYLAVANVYNGSTYNINSKIYKWNGSSFTEFQTIPTNGAADWEYFTIDGEMYLAVANEYNGSTYNISSKIYKWNGGSFVEFQVIPTIGAKSWKYFSIGQNHYLAAANWRNDSTYNINSKIYKWNGSMFIEFQSIPTNGTRDWEYFTIDGGRYLAAANHHNDLSTNINSKIYKGVEVDLSNGLVAHYPFNGNANDESGHHNNGTVHGATLTTDRFGNGNSAYSFDGVDDYIEVLKNSSMEPAAAVSVSAWVKIPAYATSWETSKFVYYSDSQIAYNDHKYGYYLDITPVNHPSFLGNYLRFVANIGGEHHQGIVGTTKMDLNRWYHVVGVYDGKYRIYVNGSLERTDNTMISGDIKYSQYEKLSIGCGRRYFKGILDDVRIYNRALSATEISQLYNGNLSTPASPDEGDAGSSPIMDTGCFIATAAYGSFMHPYVETLRKFRDEYLLSNIAGKKFVEMYYNYSPPIADFIAKNEFLKTMVRITLAPVVLASGMFLKFGVVIGWLIILASMCVLFYITRKTRRHFKTAST